MYKPLQDPLITSCIDITNLDKDFAPQETKEPSAAKRIWAKVFPKPRRCWLPTGCLVSLFSFVENVKLLCFLFEFTYATKVRLNIQKLLEVLHGALPKMSLIASDFSYLPDVKVPGERAPLVSTKVHFTAYLVGTTFSS